MQGFLQSPQSQKALVLSFHGWSGTGKNFVARMLASHLYRDGLKSECVRVFISLFHFPHHKYVDSYKVRASNTVLLWGWSSVLSLAGMEFAFFTAACRVLCFGFVSRTVLITHHWFSYCRAVLAQPQGFLSLPLCPRIQ